MLKTIRIYAEFYDGELNSAWILHAAELSPSSSVSHVYLYIDLLI